jgi:hypothetical protein
MTNYVPTFPRNIWTVPKGKIAIHNYIEHHVGQTSGEEDHRTPPDPTVNNSISTRHRVPTTRAGSN